MRNYIKIKKIFFPYDLEKNNILGVKLFRNTNKFIIYKHKNKSHKGNILTTYNKFKILDCSVCKFIHCVPIPDEQELNLFYKNKFYKQKRKTNYFLIQKKQQKWLNKIFLERLIKFEKILGKTGSVLDIGCGPGFFLKYAKKRGWDVFGIDSADRAVDYAKKKLKLKNISNNNYQDLAILKNLYDVVYLNGVLEHIDDPLRLIKICKNLLKKKGLLFLSVANDFNLFQFLSMKNISQPWWILPPEHINYFRINDIKKIFKKNNLKLVNITSSFPIEIFLLMGQNYIKNKKIGELSHLQRVQFEKSFESLGMAEFKYKIYDKFLELGLGRSIEIIVQK